ncbi:hypothetical protein D3C81_1027390 [compost metagenome]
MEAILIIWPARCCCMSGSVVAMPCSTPRMLTSIIRFHSSTLSASSFESGMTPALLTRTSTRPCNSTVKSMKDCMSSRLVTSSPITSAVPPAERISLARASRRSVRRAPKTTRAPLLASRRAVASPIPLLAPVITMTFCWMPCMFSLLFLA